MMLTIHGLPLTVKYHELKALINQECKINDFILDNLMADGPGTKKVRIGVSDDREGSYLIKCFDGYRMSGHSLRVVPVGKPLPAAASNNFSSHGGFPPRNDYPNQPGHDYNRSMDPMSRTDPMMRPDSMNRRQDPMSGRPDSMHGRPGPMAGRPDPMHGRPDPMTGRPDTHGRPDPMSARPDPWGPSGGNNPWSNQSAPSQGNMQQNYYQQPSQGINQPYRQQRPDMRPFDQRAPQSQGYGYSKPVLNPGLVKPEPRTHVLRSVEIIDQPIVRPSIQGNRYPNQDYGMPQKPITIMKDNFQGPQYNIDRQAGPPSQYPAETHPQHALGHAQPLSWAPRVEPEKQPFAKATPSYNDSKPYDRKYPETDKRPIMSKTTEPPRNVHDDYDKGYNKGPGPRFSPRRDSPIDAHGRKDVPTVRRLSPSGRRMPSPGRRMSPPGRRMSPTGRRMSPSGRRMSPPGRRMSPPGRRMSPPGRRMSPSGRRMSPSGRRISPPGRRMSPSERRMSPSDRRLPRRESPPHRPGSPHKRLEPGRRPGSPARLSPPRRDPQAGQGMRYSPSRRPLDKLPDKYAAPATARASSKEVRPAYEPPSHAPNQAMYSGGYRPNINENVQYPLPGMRPQERRGSPWQQDRDKTMSSILMKKDDDRRELTRLAKFEPRVEHQRAMLPGNMESNKSRSPRKSRSPMRRDRSPLRDRYKKHSPSPRSPRRSWALEKRRSPDIHDAPPPPVWPGQNSSDNKQYRNVPNFPERVEDDKKRMPVWERSPFDEKEDRHERRPEVEERKLHEEKTIRVRSDLGQRQPLPQPSHSTHREPTLPSHGLKPDDRFAPRDAKFAPREDFAARRDDIRRPDMDRKPYDRADFRDMPQPRSGDREDRRVVDPVHTHADRREEFPRREEARKPVRGQEAFQKEIDDVYKRAVEFTKRAEEIRRRDTSRREEYVEDRDRRDIERHEPKDYDRLKIHRDEMRYRDEAHYREEPRHEFRHPDDRQLQRSNERQLQRPEERQLQRPEERQSQRPDEPPRRHHDDLVKWDKEQAMTKKEKATEEIAQKILHKFGAGINNEMKERVLEELRLSLSKIMRDMFGNQDLSFIELVVKFNAKIDAKDEAKIFEDVMSSFPSHFRTMKRPGGEMDRRDEIPAKIMHSSEHTLKRDVTPRAMTDARVPEWNLNNQLTANVPLVMPQLDMLSQMSMVMQPVMVPEPNFMSTFEELNEVRDPPPAPEPFTNPTVYSDNQNDEGYNLFLVKDDFEPYYDTQADYLKKFLVSEIIKVSETSDGWSPDFTLKGIDQHRHYRYELVTRDESTKDWIINLDFSEFKLFNVLVYTKEELWFERAAVWLPGHSRSRNIEPLDKLKLQNRQLEGINIGKWKFVKKIVTLKGTRLYVDMPPSSARALESHKMMLSYELQKVNVFLKAIAVDKNAFDAGLKEMSVKDPTEIIEAANNSSMPSLCHDRDPNIVKIGLKGDKTLNVDQARRIKEMIIYHIFKYQQQYGNSRTDFVKYGFCLPGYFGVVPENTETKRWLLAQTIGKLNRHAIVVLGADNNSAKYIRMTAYVKADKLNLALVLGKLRQSNQGVKGLNFSLWKPLRVERSRNTGEIKFIVDMDLESVETLSKMSYNLDYLDDNHNHTVHVKYEDSSKKLEEIIKKYRAEMKDSYDVANMDISSSSSGEDDDIIYMGKI